MKQRNGKRRIRQNKRKRFVRQIILFIYRLICIGIVAIVVILVGRLYESITVKNNEKDYPKSLIALMERNPETEDFVLNYFKYKE